MSLLLLEGFDDGLRDQRWVTDIGVVGAGSGLNRAGDLQPFSATKQYIQRNLPAADEHATLTVGAWINHTLFAGGTPFALRSMWQFRSDAGATIHVTISPTASYQLAVRNGDDTLLGTTDIIWASTGIAKYVEIKVTLHDTTGSVDIWVDGVNELSLSGIDTKNGGTKTVLDAFRFASDTTNVERRFEVDDIYITNGAGASPYNGNLGDIVVETVFPDGTGNHSDFTGSDGNSTDNYLLVDENPHDSDTTYVESGTNTDRDSYTFDDVDLTSGNVRGVVVTTVVRNTGSADNLQVFTRIGVTNYDSSTFAAPAGYNASVEKVWQVSPATSANWELAEVNAAEFGIENVA